MKELTINVARDFSKYTGGAEKRVSEFSGEEFRERFLDDNFTQYDRINIELDGVLGFPWEFLEEAFGKIAGRYGKKAFFEKINLISTHDYVTSKIEYIVNHTKHEDEV